MALPELLAAKLEFDIQPAGDHEPLPLSIASTDPELQRIMLVDGPAVLGWSEWRALDEAASARHLAEILAT